MILFHLTVFDPCSFHANQVTLCDLEEFDVNGVRLLLENFEVTLTI